MNRKFTRSIQLRFREADPAQIMYFANIFSLAHDSFEDFIVEAGIPWVQWFKDYEYQVPIRQTEADFFAPLEAGQVYEVSVWVSHIGNSSFQMQYSFSQGSKVHAVVKMVHAFFDPKTKSKVAIPGAVRDRLSQFLGN